MKRFASSMRWTLTIPIAGCQTSGDLPTEGKHTCVVTPADLSECELAEDAETRGEA